MLPASSSLSLGVLDCESPEYAQWKEAWDRYGIMYAGGDRLRKAASELLVKRQKEPAEIFVERCYRVVYENYIGTILDWYVATLFRRDPEIETPEDEFYKEFVDDCDTHGTDLLTFLGAALTSAMIHRRYHVLIDLPRADRNALASKAEETATGADRAYLVGYTPLDVLDWKVDDRGQYEWIKVKRVDVFRAAPDDPTLTQRECWTYYDREGFVEYQLDRTIENGTVAKDDGKTPGVKTASGPHALSGKGVVPFVTIELPEGLWLSNRCSLLVMEHFQKSNAYAWALHQGLVTMPVVYSERNFDQIVGESYYIQLGPTDKFGWTEPEGKVFAHATDNLERLKDEIYRICYLMMQAQTRSAGNVGQSGVAKSRDYQVVMEVLRAYGEVVKNALTAILSMVADARDEDKTAVSARGMDNFDLRDMSVEIQDGTDLLALFGSKSPTFSREASKRLAQKYLDDSPPEVKDKIAKELDAATWDALPTMEQMPFPQLQPDAGLVADSERGAKP